MSIFANAKPLEKPAVSTKDTGKESVQVAGLEEYAKVDALAKSLKTVQTTLGAVIKDETMADLFYSKVCATGEFPESLRGTDGIASASLECRKRGVNQPLSEQEVEVLAKYEIPVEEAVITQELFGINPEYTTKTVYLDLISKALEPLILKGKLPSDLFVKQERVVKKVVTEDTLKVACAKREDLPKDVFSLLTVLAIKPSLEETNIGQIIEDVKGLIVEEDAKPAPAAKKAAKADAGTPPKKAKK
jgi:hypothetical protein